jgi:hypothetical protein
MENASHSHVAAGGSIMADWQGLILEVSFEEGAPTSKVERQVTDALPDLIANGTADSVTAAKGAQFVAPPH